MNRVCPEGWRLDLGSSAPRVGALGPARVRHRCPRREDLTGVRLDELPHPVGTEPFGHNHEQSRAVLATEHACVARTVDLDPVEDLATLSDAQNGVSSIRA